MALRHSALSCVSVTLSLQSSLSCVPSGVLKEELGGAKNGFWRSRNKWKDLRSISHTLESILEQSRPLQLYHNELVSNMAITAYHHVAICKRYVTHIVQFILCHLSLAIVHCDARVDGLWQRAVGGVWCGAGVQRVAWKTSWQRVHACLAQKKLDCIIGGQRFVFDVHWTVWELATVLNMCGLWVVSWRNVKADSGRYKTATHISVDVRAFWNDPYDKGAGVGWKGCMSHSVLLWQHMSPLCVQWLKESCVPETADDDNNVVENTMALKKIGQTRCCEKAVRLIINQITGFLKVFPDKHDLVLSVICFLIQLDSVWAACKIGMNLFKLSWQK